MLNIKCSLGLYLTRRVAILWDTFSGLAFDRSRRVFDQADMFTAAVWNSLSLEEFVLAGRPAHWCLPQCYINQWLWCLWPGPKCQLSVVIECGGSIEVYWQAGVLLVTADGSRARLGIQRIQRKQAQRTADMVSVGRWMNQDLAVCICINASA